MIKIVEVANGGGYHMKVRSQSRKGFIVVAITEAGARCISREHGQEIFGDADDYLDCPACSFGRKCWRCKSIDKIIGVDE